jgi:hypothetical protein
MLGDTVACIAAYANLVFRGDTGTGSVLGMPVSGPAVLVPLAIASVMAWLGGRRVLFGGAPTLAVVAAIVWVFIAAVVAIAAGSVDAKTVLVAVVATLVIAGAWSEERGR